jgi:hypothetical protein
MFFRNMTVETREEKSGLSFISKGGKGIGDTVFRQKERN